MAVSDQLARAVVQGIQAQMQQCPYHDCIVVAGGVDFKCHRFLLSACSEFFRATFGSGMKEDIENRVVLNDITAETFNLVLDSVYNARSVLNADNIADVWHAANQLQIGFLLEACELFQSKRLSKDSCVEIYIDAKLLSSKKLVELCWDVIIKEFDYLRKLEDLLFLDFEDMKRLVSSEDLSVSSEDIVLQIVLRWVSFNPHDEPIDEGPEIKILDTSSDDSKAPRNDKKKEKSKITERASHKQMANKSEDVKTDLKNLSITQSNMQDTKCKKIFTVAERKCFLPELLAASKIFLVSGTCLQTLIENKIVLENPAAFSLVRESLRYQLQPGRRHDYCPPYARHRSKSLLQNVTMAITRKNQLNLSCRTVDGTWYVLPTPPQYIGKAVTFENDIYWTDSSGTYQSAIKYKSNVNAWVTIAQLNTLRKNHALVCLDSYIYAVGGDNCTSIERFNARDDQVQGSSKWELVGDLKLAVTNIMATSCGGSIVVFGGETDGSPSTTVQSFNTQTMSASFYLDNMSGSPRNMVSFKHGDITYILQETGALWKLVSCDNTILNIEFRNMLWADPFKLMGGIIFNEELLILGDGIDPLMHREWDTTHFEHFKRIKVIERQGYCLLNTIIDKKFLVTPET
ncbi:unnamed protein product [Lymnaea stagnalis]|uniref:BTB domain-containing protein n=1 Tax=Lymnaea stagnalis TaxID=6523 RepID=A0AAV2I968_LYMST